MGRPSNTEERRAQIVEAFLTVLSKEGYARATIAAVAREAGLTSGLLHYHFGSKHEILVALVESLVARLEARHAARRARARAEPRAQLLAFVEAHVALGDDADPRAVAAWVVVGAEAVREPEVRALYREAVAGSHARLEGLVAAWLRADGKSTRGAERIAAATLAAIEGAYRIDAAAPGVLPEGWAESALRRMLDVWIAAEPARAASKARA
jgi:TetR/AcrR family transcriptional repressor of bet genes